MLKFFPVPVAFIAVVAFVADVAYAAEAPPAPPAGAGLIGMLPLILLFVIFYFLLIRPQQKKMKEHKELIGKLSKGDEVVTTGGIHGRITGVADETVTMEVAKEVRIKVSRESVGRVKGA